MKSEKLYEILEGIDEDYIKESEELGSASGGTLKRKTIKIKTILIAAVVALLVCGTAAAAAITWLTPRVETYESGFDLIFDGGYLSLPEETVNTIIDTWGVVGEENEVRLYVFKTIKEWQSVFGAPFLANDYIDTDEDAKSEIPKYPNGVLDINGDTEYGDIATAVLFKVSDGELKPYRAQTYFGVSWKKYEDGKTVVPWRGDITVIIPLCKEAANELRFQRQTNEKQSYELVEEGKTPSGIPYVITKTTFNLEEYFTTTARDPDEYQALIRLFYGYDSVIFSLDATIRSPEEADETVMLMKEIVDTFKVHYPQ